MKPFNLISAFISLLAVFSTAAFGQSGQMPSGTLWGNATASQGLGTASLPLPVLDRGGATGTSGHKLPYLDGSPNLWSGVNGFGKIPESNVILEVGTAQAAPGASASLPTAFTDTTAMAAGVGGRIGFQGKFNNAGDYTGFGAIAGIKKNGTTGDITGQLVFYSRDAASGTWGLPKVYIGGDTAAIINWPHTAFEVPGLTILGSGQTATLDTNGPPIPISVAIFSGSVASKITTGDTPTVLINRIENISTGGNDGSNGPGLLVRVNGYGVRQPVAIVGSSFNSTSSRSDVAGIYGVAENFSTDIIDISHGAFAGFFSAAGFGPH